MQIAFISDIHANLPAWKAVQADMAANNVDKIICLGDIVGYGPSPADVLSEVYSAVHHFVLGNHDAVVAGTLNPAGFNPYAKKLIQICQERLGDRAVDFFNDVPLLLRNSTFACSHGSPAQPAKFSYIFKKSDAEAAWARTSHRLQIMGHTHRPGIFELSGDGECRKSGAMYRPFKLDPESRYIINCGSVGMPRDGDFRSCYTIFDSEQDSIRWQRVAYDIDAFVSSVRESYDDARLVKFLLKRVKSRDDSSVREMIDFAPGESSLSEEVEEERDIEQMRATATRWKLIAGGISALLVVAVCTFLAFWQSLPDPRTAAGVQRAAIELAPGTQPALLELFPSQNAQAEGIPAGWAISVGDGRSQNVRFQKDNIVMQSSDDGRPIVVRTPRLSTEGVGKITVGLDGVLNRDFMGAIPMLVIDHFYEDGTLQEGADRQSLSVQGEKLSKKYTMASIPKEVRAVRFRFQGRFRGEIRISKWDVRATASARRWLDSYGGLDINEADADLFEKLPGIGKITAERIVEYRKDNGPYKSVNGLLQVAGIGNETLDNIEKHVWVSHGLEK